MLGRMAKTVRCAMRGEFWIANKFQDCRRKRLAIPRINEKAILPVLDNFWNVANLRRDDGAAAGESLTQDDRRCFGAQRCNHYHVACGVDVRCIPTISRHKDSVRQSGAIDRVSYVDAAFQLAGSLAYDDETGVGALL